MGLIKLHDKYFKTFITNDKIEASIAEVAKKINNDFKECEPPIFLSVLNGSFMFTASLMKEIDFTAEISFVKLSSYEGTCTTGEVKRLIGIDSEKIKGRDIIIIEDIVDTGVTIVELHKILTEAEAASIKICTLLLKPKSYDKEVKIDYAAMEIPNDFIVGFGLDYNELGRNYKDIYVLN